MKMKRSEYASIPIKGFYRALEGKIKNRNIFKSKGCQIGHVNELSPEKCFNLAFCSPMFFSTPAS